MSKCRDENTCFNLCQIFAFLLHNVWLYYFYSTVFSDYCTALFHPGISSPCCIIQLFNFQWKSAKYKLNSTNSYIIFKKTDAQLIPSKQNIEVKYYSPATQGLTNTNVIYPCTYAEIIITTSKWPRGFSTSLRLFKYKWRLWLWYLQWTVS